uniref:Ig-like domain-containing protein n=1 Tax=Spermophilus dauricus TaxID=99837 RepID=A0A8C9PFH3_SPEDA
MEPPSASPHRGHVSWQGILLAVSPLTFWNLPTTAQLAIESVPFTAAEGTDVLLLAHNVSENVKGYTWYKGERGIDSHQIAIYLTATQGIIPGPAYSGREMVYPNGSLLFQRVTLEDTGFYTLQTLSSDLQAEKASGHICVYQSVTQPSILASNVSITEEGPVWILNSQTLQLTDRMQLSPDHRTLSIDPVRPEDPGEYQCEASNPASSTRSGPLKLALSPETSLFSWACVPIPPLPAQTTPWVLFQVPLNSPRVAMSSMRCDRRS